MPQPSSLCECLMGSLSSTTLPYFLYTFGHIISSRLLSFVKVRVLEVATGL